MRRNVDKEVTNKWSVDEYGPWSNFPIFSSSHWYQCFWNVKTLSAFTNLYLFLSVIFNTSYDTFYIWQWTRFLITPSEKSVPTCHKRLLRVNMVLRVESYRFHGLILDTRTRVTSLPILYSIKTSVPDPGLIFGN